MLFTSPNFLGEFFWGEFYTGLQSSKEDLLAIMDLTHSKRVF